MKSWQFKLFVAAVLLCIGFFVGQWSKKTVENIVTIGGKPFGIVMRDMTKPKLPYLILIPSEERVDSFTIYEDTPFGEIPVVRETRCFPIPVFVNDKDESHEGEVSVWVQGIMDSIVVNIPIKRITIKEAVKRPLNWDLGLYAWVDQHKDISITTEGNLVFFKRFVLGTRIEANKDFEVRARVGIGLKL